MRSTPTNRSAVPTDRAALRLAQLALVAGAPDVRPGAGGPETPPEWWSDHTRLAVAADGPSGPGGPVGALAEPPLILHPGRHAARRRGGAALEAVRDRLPPLGQVGSAHLAVVALGAALAIAVTSWWLLRDRGAVEPLPVSTSAAGLVGPSLSPVAETAPVGEPGSAAPSESATDAVAGRVTVDVVGKVRRPGIAVLDAGARVVDAIKAAGGALRGVDLTSLNLARVVVDGEQIAVGVGGAGPPAVSAAPGVSPAPGALVNLNTATVDQLESLPDVGPVTAQSILAWRQQHGGFTSVDQLLDVDGIGDKTLARLTPYVTV